ncbi:MAG: hypothetical protein BMS9Abin26_1142 [Gammaproteobacteria bacterium]|nr:MAG: hypothetical protein BMS9Abin26_1142 [Gammaproteobacteria bacterium]
MEVLITLVILAVGLLGLASLQASGMKLNHSAYLRSQAQLLAYDIVDRMRANRTEAMNTNNYQQDLNTDPASPSTNCATSTCTEAQMAAFDLFEWREIVDEYLPQGEGSVTIRALGDGGRLYIIDIRWLDDRNVKVTATDPSSYNKRYQTFQFKTDL